MTGTAPARRPAAVPAPRPAAVVAALLAAATVLLALLPPVRGAGAQGVSAQGAAQPQVIDLPIVSVDTGARPELRMVVAAPSQFGGQTLPASAFTLTENGQGRPLQVQPLPDEGLEVVLVVDTSGSMSGAAINAAKAAALTLLDRLPPAVPVTVVGFGATVNVLAARSTDEAAQARAVAGLRAAGETALYDAVAVGVTQLVASPARKFMVLLSDGGDTVSTNTLDGAAAILARDRVAVVVVELRTAESNSAALAQIASATGGSVVQATDPAALAGAFDSVAARLVRQYELRWQTQATSGADVTVVLTANGLTASTTRRIELGPAANPTAGAVQAAVAAAANQPAQGPLRAPVKGRDNGFAVWAGPASIGAAVLVGLLALLLPGVPRAKGLRSRSARPRDTLQSITERAGAAASRILPGDQETRIGALLERAGINLRAGEFVALVFGAAAVGFALGAVAAGPVIGLAAAAIVVMLAKVIVDGLARRRQTRFNDQLADTLGLMAGTLRAGYGVSQAIETATREADSPTAEEFRRLVVETRLGRDFTEAMTAMAKRVTSTDLEWVVQAFEIHAEVGGNLAEVLETVAKTIRERTRIRRQIQVLSAEGILSAVILFSLPVVVSVIVTATNPDYLTELTGTTPGRIMLGIALVLEVIGGLWLRRLVKPVF